MSLTSLLRTLEPENLRRQLILLKLWIKLYCCIASIHNSCSPRCLLGSNGFRHVNSFLTTVSNFDVLISIEMRAVSEAISLVLAWLAPQKKTIFRATKRALRISVLNSADSKFQEEHCWGNDGVKRASINNLVCSKVSNARHLKKCSSKWCLWIQV